MSSFDKFIFTVAQSTVNLAATFFFATTILLLLLGGNDLVSFPSIYFTVDGVETCGPFELFNCD
jgi:hypothetical protein